MNIYFDTGLILPLYFEEAFSAVVNRFVETEKAPIAINLLHETEFENACRLKAFRGEMPMAKVDAVLDNRDADIAAGLLVRRPVNWIQVFEESRRMIAAGTARTGCRTLDVMHVAIALRWGFERFASSDERQRKIAKLAGLKVVNLEAA